MATCLKTKAYHLLFKKVVTICQLSRRLDLFEKAIAATDATFSQAKSELSHVSVSGR
jgi:hypothetical protein